MVVLLGGIAVEVVKDGGSEVRVLSANLRPMSMEGFSLTPRNG